MSRPRIALDHRPALLGSSGIPRAVRELARALAARDTLDLHLFGHSWARTLDRRVPAGATLHRSRLPGRALGVLAGLGLGAERLSGGAELFHWTDYIHPPVGRRTPVVLTVHDVAFARDPRWHGVRDTQVLLERTRRAAARGARVVCPTRATATDAGEFLGVPDHKLAVIPFGCDHALPAADTSLVPERPYLLQVGTLEPRKNHLRMLQAWRALGADRPRLVVVGRPGWECDDIVAALRLAADREPLSWHDHATDAELRGLLESARALLYPSSLEGFGFPPLEALAAGVPVLAGDTPALREVLGDAATFADPDNPDALAQGLRDLLTAPPDPGGLRAQAARYRWADCAAAHEALYREVLGA